MAHVLSAILIPLRRCIFMLPVNSAAVGSKAHARNCS
jgi:hypothetical protein